MAFKRLRTAVLLTAVVSSTTSVATAQTAKHDTGTGGKDFYVTIGYKTWFNSWQTFNITNPGLQGANLQGILSDLTLAQIPTTSLQYKNLFVTGGYFFSQTYAFPDYSDVLDVGGTPHHGTFKTTGKRKEIDANLGFLVHPSIALTAGYKRVEQNYHSEFTAPGLAGDTTNATTTYQGPTVGIALRASVGGGVGLYENLAYGFMKIKEDAAETARYLSSEFGLTYTFQPVSVVLAFKYQDIDTHLNDPEFPGQKGSDVTIGPIIGALIRF